MEESKCDRFDKALPLICGILVSIVCIVAGLWTLIQGIIDNNYIWIEGIFLILLGIFSLYMFSYIGIKWRRGQLGELFKS